MKHLLPYFFLIAVVTGCAEKQNANTLSSRLPGKTWKMYQFTDTSKHKPVFLYFNFDEKEAYQEFQGYSKKEITSDYSKGGYQIDGSVLTLKDKEKAYHFQCTVNDSTIILKPIDASMGGTNQRELVFTESH